MQKLFAQLFPSSTILCSFSRSFQRCSVRCGTSSQTSKSKGLIRANNFFCIYYLPDYRITMRKHQYSASVCAKSVFPIVPKLDHIIQHFMLFLMMYSKLGHKLTNVKTASINKVLIAFVHRITLRKHLYIHQAFMQNLFAQLFPNSTILRCFSRCFQRCSVRCGTSSQTSKSKGLIRANYFFCIY